MIKEITAVIMGITTGLIVAIFLTGALLKDKDETRAKQCETVGITEIGSTIINCSIREVK